MMSPEEIATLIVVVPLVAFYLGMRVYIHRWSRRYVEVVLRRVSRR